MNHVETVLIILLSVGFLILLILSIVLISIMVAIMKNVKRISERAEEATGNIANVAALVGQKIAPLAVSAAVTTLLRRFRGRKSKED